MMCLWTERNVCGVDTLTSPPTSNYNKMIKIVVRLPSKDTPSDRFSSARDQKDNDMKFFN